MAQTGVTGENADSNTSSSQPEGNGVFILGPDGKKTSLTKGTYYLDLKQNIKQDRFTTEASVRIRIDKIQTGANYTG